MIDFVMITLIEEYQDILKEEGYYPDDMADEEKVLDAYNYALMLDGETGE